MVNIRKIYDEFHSASIEEQEAVSIKLEEAAISYWSTGKASQDQLNAIRYGCRRCGLKWPPDDYIQIDRDGRPRLVFDGNGNSDCCEGCFLCGENLPAYWGNQVEWGDLFSSERDDHCEQRYGCSVETLLGIQGGKHNGWHNWFDWRDYTDARCGPCMARELSQALEQARKEKDLLPRQQNDVCVVCLIRDIIGDLMRWWYEAGGAKSGAIYAYPPYLKYEIEPGEPAPPCHHQPSARARAARAVAKRRARIQVHGFHIPYNKGKVKAALLKQQDKKCAGCKCVFTKKFPAALDHIWPVNPYGWDCRENLQLLCTACNGNKGNKDPLVWGKLLEKKQLNYYRQVAEICERLMVEKRATDAR